VLNEKEEISVCSLACSIVIETKLSSTSCSAHNLKSKNFYPKNIRGNKCFMLLKTIVNQIAAARVTIEKLLRASQ
jgi:hypothetical protein